jgi:hypothetical protein
MGLRGSDKYSVIVKRDRCINASVCCKLSQVVKAVPFVT